MRQHTVTVYLGLGANLGEREAQIRRGLRRLQERGAVLLFRVSSLYESEPVGWSGGPWYLNGAAMGITILEPLRLLRALKETEAEAGRKVGADGGPRNAPRPLDLDLLLYGEETIRTPELWVPHPRMLEREFVLRPLAEIAPEIEVAPGLTAAAAASLAATRPGRAIRPWAQVEREDDDATLCV